MSTSSERAVERSDALPWLDLDGRRWLSVRGHELTRHELVTTANDWMPYPISDELLAVDLAVACVETGDESGARQHLESPAVRDTLAAILEDALGTGDLTNRRASRRSSTILGLHRRDLSALSGVASRLDPQLAQLFAEFDANEHLVRRAHDSGIQTLLSTEVARAGTDSLMGDSRPVTHINTAPIDLAVVPPRVFSWGGPDADELRLIRNEGRSTAEIRVEVDSPAAVAGEYTAFVTSGELTAEAPLVRSDAKGRLRATIDLWPSSAADDGRSMHFGIRHHRASLDSARIRLESGVAEATRSLIEAWSRLRLGHAYLAVGHIGAEIAADIWVSKSIYRVARVAQTVLDARSGELSSGSSALTAGAASLRHANRAVASDAEAYLGDSDHWDDKPDLSGARRPLLCETYLVLGERRLASHSRADGVQR
jgi:hypothetical protein